MTILIMIWFYGRNVDNVKRRNESQLAIMNIEKRMKARKTNEEMAKIRCENDQTERPEESINENICERMAVMKTIMNETEMTLKICINEDQWNEKA